jgi:hypothetical protein
MVNTIMKVSLIVALVLTIIVSCTVFGETSRKPTNWQPVYGVQFPNAKAFIDSNSSEANEMPGGEKINYAEILISYSVPITTVVGKQTIVFSGMVRHIVVDCSSGLSAPIYDFYFAEAKPTRANKPLGALEYTAPIRDISTTMSKSSPMYQAICPKYI